MRKEARGGGGVTSDRKVERRVLRLEGHKGGGEMGKVGRGTKNKFY